MPTMTRTNTLAATNCGLTVNVTAHENATAIETEFLHTYENYVTNKVLLKLEAAQEASVPHCFVRYLDLQYHGDLDPREFMWNLYNALGAAGYDVTLYNLDMRSGFPWVEVNLCKEV